MVIHGLVASTLRQKVVPDYGRCYEYVGDIQVDHFCNGTDMHQEFNSPNNGNCFYACVGNVWFIIQPSNLTSYHWRNLLKFCETGSISSAKPGNEFLGERTVNTRFA